MLRDSSIETRGAEDGALRSIAEELWPAGQRPHVNDIITRDSRVCLGLNRDSHVSTYLSSSKLNYYGRARARACDSSSSSHPEHTDLVAAAGDGTVSKQQQQLPRTKSVVRGAWRRRAAERQSLLLPPQDDSAGLGEGEEREKGSLQGDPEALVLNLVVFSCCEDFIM